METSNYILGFLLLLFTIEDLIGTEKVRRLEKNWITRSRQTLFAWRNSLSETTRWWPKLLYLATSEFFILFLIGAVLNWTVTGNFGTWQGLSWLVAAVLIGAIGLIQNALFKKLLLPNSLRQIPIEARWVGWLSLSYQSIFEKAETEIEDQGSMAWWASYRNEFFAFRMAFLLLLSVLVTPPVVLLSILFRTLLYSVQMCLWIVFFGPSLAFDALRGKMGAPGFFNVARWVITVSIFIVSLLIA